MDYFFGPLPQFYCLYFYIISIFGGVFMLLSLIGIVMIALSSDKNKMVVMYLINVQSEQNLFELINEVKKLKINNIDYFKIQNVL